MSTEGVELFKIGEDKTGSRTYDAVYIKDSNSVAVSSGFGSNKCITIIDIVSNEVLTNISSWLWSSDHCLSCKIVWFDLDYGF
jgi:hypothetical protein